MIELNGQALDNLPLGELTWKRDLLYFEGPLLSEFVSDKNECYLKYWCDCDSQYNRWMLFKVKEQDRLRLVLGEKSLLQVIESQPDHYVFISDEGTNQSIYSLLNSQSIPEQYLPEPDSFLDIEDYVEDENITSLVFEDQWDFEELKNIYRKFTQVYDFLFVTNSFSSSSGDAMPWQGGFSSVHFYNKIRNLIPNQSTSKLHAIHYASPGYMKMTTDNAFGEIALNAIEHYKENKHGVDRCYLDLQNIIRELDLNNMTPSNAVSAFSSDQNCQNLYRNLVNNLSGVTLSWFDSYAENDFERCKIAMAHVRRLRQFTNFLIEKNVRVVSSLIS
ncbi:hypothetical protein [Vibrio splendidus]|uniref:hypothetical protein n=1 Tax=Vibrio splendidus TaxID=29497 RepID=UPI002118F3AD|nr:hypothetical protein [Vibrio splendidus]MCQ8870100.1 hypothetical protein [Vibrio splendidus]